MEAREIKFRVWNFKLKEMFSWENIERAKGENIWLWISVNKKQENNRLMQFTGKKDKNGVEVYEGDILGGYGKDHPRGEYISFVKWNKEKAEWYLNKAWIGGQRNLWRWAGVMCVIGNIYENPELLTTQELNQLKK